MAIWLLSVISAIKLFWAPIVQAPDPVLVVTDTLFGLREVRADSADVSPAVSEIVDPKVFLNVSEQSAKLAEFLGAQGKHLDHQLARKGDPGYPESQTLYFEGVLSTISGLNGPWRPSASTFNSTATLWCAGSSTGKTQTSELGRRR